MPSRRARRRGRAWSELLEELDQDGVLDRDCLDAAARGLVELVRLRSGALPDDVAVVLCREVAP